MKERTERGGGDRKMTRPIKALAAAAAAATLLIPALSGCDSTSTAAAQPPQPVKVTPTQSPGDLANQKAEAAYRNAFHTMNLGLWNGRPPTQAQMQRYMTGSYLKFVAPETHGYTGKGTGYIDGVSFAGFMGDPSSPSQVNMIGCEDWTKVRAFKDGKDVTPAGLRMYVQHLVASRGSDGVWRVSKQSSTTKVASADWATQPCTMGPKSS